jgi:GNAT superfamily N-acetyltransferase
MLTEHLTFRFSVVPSTEVAQAFAFHASIADSNEHIWPRTRAQLGAYADDNSLFGARQADTGQFVGLCYIKRDSDTEPFELGGLTVPKDFQKSGIGGMLVRFALAHVMAFDDPWSTQQDVIAHVHESNNNPRHLIEDQLFFEHQERKKYPGEGFPLSMKRDADGNVVGDIFRFTRKGLRALADWFTNDFRGTLKNGAKVEFDLGAVTLGELLEDLREMASRYPQ